MPFSCIPNNSRRNSTHIEKKWATPHTTRERFNRRIAKIKIAAKDALKKNRPHKKPKEKKVNPHSRDWNTLVKRAIYGFKRDPEKPELDLSGMALSKLPMGGVAECPLQYMKVLNLSHNRFCIVPETAAKYPYEGINLSYNPLHDFSALSLMPTLTALFLTNIELSSFPEELLTLVSLKELDLSNNPLRMLPESIGSSFPHLEKLRVANTQLSSLPMEIADTNLHELDVSRNRITKLPPSLRRLLITKLNTEETGIPQKEARRFLKAGLKNKENDLSDLFRSMKLEQTPTQ